MVESGGKLKSLEYNTWYKNISKETGILVGSGIEGQYVFNLGIDRRVRLKNNVRSMGYVIKDTETTLVKFLGMEESEEDEDG